MKVIPKGTFLLRQDKVGDVYKDVLARNGVEMEVSEEEYKRFQSKFIDPVKQEKEAKRFREIREAELKRQQEMKK